MFSRNFKENVKHTLSISELIILEFWNFCVEDDDEPEDGRDVSLLRADQALIVSGCDHSFPSHGRVPRSSHLASWSWTREPSES